MTHCWADYLDTLEFGSDEWAHAMATGESATCLLPDGHEGPHLRKRRVGSAHGGGSAVSGVRLYVGSHASRVQGERQDLAGARCYSAAHRLQAPMPLLNTDALLDSGAFTDAPPNRLTPEAALARQLAWERRAADMSECPEWTVSRVVSYDRLIDETWVGGEKLKRRWSLRDADSAVEETVAAARYLAGVRARIAPRGLVLAAQGVDALQYAECAAAVLQVALPGDWLGLGGWCILGRYTSWLPEFWRTIRLVLPMCRVAGVRHVHIFGVLYAPALGGLLWLADEYGLAVSTDSGAPILACTWQNQRKSGARCAYWRDNVAWWQAFLAGLRDSEHYCEPPDIKPARQMGLPL